MNRRKIIYIGLLLILTVILSVTYFSYAFFTGKSEQRGKLNIVAGTLNYKIESEDLNNNNAITLAANTNRKINIEITSLNTINSKYELYYLTTSEDVIVGYKSDTENLPTGSINANAKKTITIIIKNTSNTSQTITFGVQGGFSSNELVLDQSNNAINSYTSKTVIAFNANGGSVTTGEIEVDYDEPIGSLEKPTRNGYTFKGWFTAANDGEQISADSIINSDTTLYAQWIQGYLLRVGGNSPYAPYNEKVCSRFSVGGNVVHDGYLGTGSQTMYVSPGTTISVYSYYGSGSIWYTASNSRICSSKANAYFTMPNYPLSVGIGDSWGGRDRTIRLNRIDDEGNILEAVSLSIGCN